jgi:acyl-[acyl-carrier-protein] desaturase
MAKRTILENRFYDLFLEFFAHAEAHRRWNVFEDIPWHQATQTPDPEVANLIETYYAVELYLPDYIRHTLGIVRHSRGRAWFQANWGYEESKHSIALERWLIHSGARTEEEVYQWEGDVLNQTFEPFYDDVLHTLCYVVLQEFATGLTYLRLRSAIEEKGLSDPALSGLLGLIHRDEVAHFKFFKRCLDIYMDYDRDSVLDSFSVVVSQFQMPADHLVPGWKERDSLTKKWGIINDRIFLTKVVRPVMKNLGIDHAEMRALRKTIAARGEKVIPDRIALIDANVEEQDRTLAEEASGCETGDPRAV